MEIYVSLLSPFLTVLLGSIVAYLMAKRLRKELISVAFEIIEEKQQELSEFTQEFLNSADGQKLLYSVGALIGSGVMGGTGIKRGSGKFKWQDLASQVVSSFIQNKIGINPQLQQPSQHENTGTKANISKDRHILGSA